MTKSIALLSAVVSLCASAADLLIDTDMMTDCDDVAALELAFACERKGDARILAVTVSSSYPKSVPVTEAVCAYCGRADIPVGAPKNGTGYRREDSCFLDKVAAEFPHAHAANDDAPDAVEVMRRTLAAAKDGSVTLVTLGYLSNVATLLKSGADAISPLDGRSLLALKVKEWVCMGGNFPNDPAKDNVNFTRDAPAALFSLTNYPGRITFVGREIGHNIFLGDRFHELPAANPLRRAYELHRGRYGTNWDHHTADPSTILYAVYGEGERFGRVEGTLHLKPNCAFTWDDTRPSNMSYITQREPRTATALAMERLLLPDDSSRFPPSLRVSANRRFLETTEGKPFFYLADTAWELFHRLDREEARRYLDNRMVRGFNVVQAVALAEEDGLETPNAYGFRPFADPKVPVPLARDGLDNDYWDHVDFIIDEANRRGITVALLPTWGKWWKEQCVFTPESARSYATWLAKRYREKAIIWVLGGDRLFDGPQDVEMMRAFAEGLRAGDGGSHLITMHPRGGHGSSEQFHAEPWLDFNMWQNGHGNAYARYDNTLQTWQRDDPVKPVIDGEPIYEGHPVAFNPRENGYSVASDVRRALYWDLFNGACGHTYGHHAVWQMYGSKAANKVAPNGKNCPPMPWYEAIEAAGAAQMQHAKNLLLRYPYFTRVPAPEMIVADPQSKNIVPGAGTRRFVATRDSEGSYAFVYAPVGRAFTLDLQSLRDNKLRYSWMDPRDGSQSDWTTIRRGNRVRFISPTPDESVDWVLIIESVPAQ